MSYPTPCRLVTSLVFDVTMLVCWAVGVSGDLMIENGQVRMTLVVLSQLRTISRPAYSHLRLGMVPDCIWREVGLLGVCLAVQLGVMVALWLGFAWVCFLCDR